MKIKHVVLNTDIFGDPDDLWALLFLLNSPEISIDMIITSDEHNGGRAVHTRHLLRDLCIDIPVYAGVDLGNTDCYFAPNLTLPHIPAAYQTALDSVTHDFTFACISPQRELASVVNLLKKQKTPIIIMGGCTLRAEHNIKVDPESANTVLASGANTYWVPLDLTANEQLRIDPTCALYEKVRTSTAPAAKYLRHNLEAFFTHKHPSHLLHDPLAVSTIIDDNILRFEPRRFQLRDSQFFSTNHSKGYEIKYGVAADYTRFITLFESRMKRWLD